MGRIDGFSTRETGRTDALSRGLATVCLGVSAFLIPLFPGIAQETVPPEIPSPAEAFEAAPGALFFDGVYEHRSRGRAGYLRGHVKIKRAGDRALAVYGEYLKEDGPPDQATFALGAPDGRVIRYIAFHPESKVQFEMHEDRIVASDSYRGKYNVAWEIPGTDTRFDPNARPDMYATAPLLLNGLALEPGEKRTVPVYDLVIQTGDRMVDYEIELEHRGRVTVEVPAGAFEAAHIVQTQSRTAPTWYQKRQGHITEFWMLDNGVIVRILRHREPYELLLESVTVPAELPGRINAPQTP